MNFRIIVKIIQNEYPTWLAISACLALFLISISMKVWRGRTDMLSFVSSLNIRMVLIIEIIDKVKINKFFCYRMSVRFM